MGRKLGTGAVALASIAAMGMAMGTAAMAGSAKCAKPDEITAVQAAAVQQELMVAALTCNQIANFNAFQTGFGPELRSSDADLQKMFRRLYGGGRGTAEYHAFKTRLANDSSIRSIRNNADYCQEAARVFSLALDPGKPPLGVFVASIQVTEQSPVDSCAIKVAVGLPIPNIVPKPNPLRLAMVAPAEATPVAAPAPAAAPAPQPATPAETPKKDEKSSGWFSGIFH
jgi:hypothetical protein